MNSKVLAGFAGGALALALAAGFIATSSGSNAQPSTAAQTGALPIELLPSGAMGAGTRWSWQGRAARGRADPGHG